MRLFEILAVTFIATCQFLFALADLVKTPPNTALEPLTMTPRQRTIPGLLVGGKGVGRRQAIGDYCGGRSYCSLGSKCCGGVGDGCCLISQNCVRDFLGNPACCPIGSLCGGLAPPPSTYTWTSTSTYTSTRTRTSTSSTFTVEESDVITEIPETTSTSSTSTSSTSTNRTPITTTTAQPTQTTPGGGPVILSGASKRVEGGVIVALWTTAILLFI